MRAWLFLLFISLFISKYEVSGKNQCFSNRDCHRGVKLCVTKKGGLSCLWGKCKKYNVCAECTKDSDCKKWFNLDDCISNKCYLRDYFRDPAVIGWSPPMRRISQPTYSYIYPISYYANSGYGYAPIYQ